MKMEPLLCAHQGFAVLAGLEDTLCSANTRRLYWMCHKGVGTRAGFGREAVALRKACDTGRHLICALPRVWHGRCWRSMR